MVVKLYLKGINILNSIAKIKNSLYNNQWYELLHLYGEQPSIKSYESCQVGNEAAISSVFMWRLFSIEV